MPKGGQRVSRSHPSRGHRDVLSEVDYIVSRAARCEPRVVTLGPLLFFSTDTGDAWLLDPEDGLALCLAEAGSRLPVQLVETATSYAIGWTASYTCEGDAFVVMTASSQRVILGYPVADIVQAWQRAQR